MTHPIPNDVLCIHHNDADGACAAWVLAEHVGWKTAFVAADYKDAPPLEEARGRHVFVLDFSYTLPELMALAEAAWRLTVIDHHTSSAPVLRALVGAEAWDGGPFILRHNQVVLVHDTNRSGCALTWDWLDSPGHGVPPEQQRAWFVDYVQDHDLWRWELPDSKEINAYLQTLDYTPEAYDSLGYILPENARVRGGDVLRHQARLVAQLAKNAVRGTIPLPQGLSYDPLYELDTVPIVNAPVLVSEVLHELCQGEPYAAAWHERADGSYKWSLRSDEDGVDVSQLAEERGGGGHKHAAGFVWRGNLDEE